MTLHEQELLSFLEPILAHLGVEKDCVQNVEMGVGGLILEWETVFHNVEFIPLSVVLDDNPVKAYEMLKNHRRMDFYQGLRKTNPSASALKLLNRFLSR